MKFRDEHTSQDRLVRRVQADHGRPPRLRDRAVVRRGASAKPTSRPRRRRRSATSPRATTRRRASPASSATSRRPCRPGSRRLLDRVPKQAAGILLFRPRPARVSQVLLAHPGRPAVGAQGSTAPGPFRRASSPTASCRSTPPSANSKRRWARRRPGDFQSLGTLKQPSGKVIHAWAAESDFDAASVKSNLFSMEWPPKSGRMAEFPEVDRAAWFSIDEARHENTKGPGAVSRSAPGPFEVP